MINKLKLGRESSIFEQEVLLSLSSINQSIKIVGGYIVWAIFVLICFLSSTKLSPDFNLLFGVVSLFGFLSLTIALVWRINKNMGRLKEGEQKTKEEGKE